MSTPAPIAVALDVPSLAEAQLLVEQTEPYVEAFKVGLELFIAAGAIPRTSRKIVLDLKLHDIPATVERAVRAAGDRGVRFATIHIQQRAAMEAAVRAAEPYGLMLLGVTVLTSYGVTDLRDLGVTTTMREAVSERARLGRSAGLRGFVCSPAEVGAMRRGHAEDFLMVPGVRPAESATDEHARVGTPEQALGDGADLLVIGRPIRDAADPGAAAKRVAEQLATS